MAESAQEDHSARFLEQTLARMAEAPPGYSTLLVSLNYALGFVLVNLTISFSLAFYLALRATRTSRRDSGHMLLRGLGAVFMAPFRWRSPRHPTQDPA